MLDVNMIIYLFVMIFIITLMIIFVSNLDCNFQLCLFKSFGKRIETLEGKVCWITGAGSGIGRSLADLLSNNGIRLVISDIDGDKLEEVKRLCLATGHLKDNDVLVLCFDIRDTERHQSLVSKVLSHFERLDIVVLNVGRSQRASFADIDVQVDRQLFEVNVFGSVGLSRQVLRHIEFSRKIR